MANSAVTFPPRLRPSWRNLWSWLRWHTLFTRQQGLRFAEDQAAVYAQHLNDRFDAMLKILEPVLGEQLYAEWDRLAGETASQPRQRHLAAVRTGTR